MIATSLESFAFVVPVVALVVGAVLGAMLERSRSRAGLMSKRYRDYLESLFEAADNRDARSNEIARSNERDSRNALETRPLPLRN